MKVILKKTLLEQICDANRDAKVKGREVDKVEVTRDEALQIKREMRIYCVGRPPVGYLGMIVGVRVFVVESEKEDF